MLWHFHALYCLIKKHIDKAWTALRMCSHSVHKYSLIYQQDVHTNLFVCETIDCKHRSDTYHARFSFLEQKCLSSSMSFSISFGHACVSAVALNHVMAYSKLTYLDRGFPLKSAISNALQNLMLSGISGMSAGEKRRLGNDSQHYEQTENEVGAIFYEANHFKLLVITTRWSRVGMGRKKGRWK